MILNGGHSGPSALVGAARSIHFALCQDNHPPTPHCKKGQRFHFSKPGCPLLNSPWPGNILIILGQGEFG
jgi:hypothetical protein